MKRNKYTTFSLIIIAMVAITMIFSTNQSSKLDAGTYIYDASEIVNDSSIIINDDNTFVYSISMLHSYLATGVYEIDGNELTLITSEGDLLLTINSKNKTITMVENPFNTESIGKTFILQEK